MKNVFHNRAQFFNIEQKDNKTLDEYWKKNSWISKKRACSTDSHPKKSLTKLQPQKNDAKVQDKFIKRPLKIQMVLETIELDNYNRNYGDKNPKIKSKGKHHRAVPQNKSVNKTSTEEAIE